MLLGFESVVDAFGFEGRSNARSPTAMNSAPKAMLIAALFNRGVHEQPHQHDGEHHPLGLRAAEVEQRGFEARARPHAEHGDQHDQGFGGAAPGEVFQQVVGQLGDREDEDQVKEELERRNRVLLGGLSR
jgi:hypothetical protein